MASTKKNTKERGPTLVAVLSPLEEGKWRIEISETDNHDFNAEDRREAFAYAHSHVGNIALNSETPFEAFRIEAGDEKSEFVETKIVRTIVRTVHRPQKPTVTRIAEREFRRAAHLASKGKTELANSALERAREALGKDVKNG